MGDKVAAVIQARAGSTRLPRKVLADICGRSQLERVVERCRLAASVGRVIVATTLDDDDDAVADEVRRIGAELARGAAQDVLARYVGTVRQFGLGELLRITADNPLVDPRIIDAVVARSRAAPGDYVAAEGYPLGLGDVELVTSNALLRAADEAPASAPEREHVTAWIVQHQDRFRVDTLRAEGAERRPDLRLTVDYPADLEVVRFVYASMLPRHDFETIDIIRLLDDHPSWAQRNHGIKQRGAK